MWVKDTACVTLKAATKETKLKSNYIYDILVFVYSSVYCTYMWPYLCISYNICTYAPHNVSILSTYIRNTYDTKVPVYIFIVSRAHL